MVMFNFAQKGGGGKPLHTPLSPILTSMETMSLFDDRINKVLKY